MSLVRLTQTKCSLLYSVSCDVIINFDKDTPYVMLGELIQRTTQVILYEGAMSGRPHGMHAAEFCCMMQGSARVQT